MFSKIWLQFRYYRVLSKALLGFSVPDNQPSMTAHYITLTVPPYWFPCPINSYLSAPDHDPVCDLDSGPAFKAQECRR